MLSVQIAFCGQSRHSRPATNIFEAHKIFVTPRRREQHTKLKSVHMLTTLCGNDVSFTATDNLRETLFMINGIPFSATYSTV